MVNPFGSNTKTYGDVHFVTKQYEKTVKGLQFPVKVNNTGGMFARNFNEEAIKDGLIQLLMTQRGERPMRYDYGTTLRASVFAPLDSQTVSELRNSIQTAIQKYEPRVVIRELNVVPVTDNSQINVELVFSVKDNVFFTDRIALTVNSQGVQLNG
jgi:phage baseplate assembly protein W